MVPEDVLADPNGNAAAAFRAAALRDVGAIIQQSNFLAHLQNTEVALRKALCIVANARLYELRQGWTTSTSHEVLSQIMSEIAMKKAFDSGVPDAAAVNAALLRIVIPTVDMLGLQFAELQQNGVKVEEIYQAFCRTDERSNSELAAVQCDTGSDPLEETGQCGSGDRGETAGEAS